MSKQHIDIHVQSEATPAAVYALLIDGASWPSCSPLGTFELERTAPDGGEGVGAIRIFRTGRVTSREEIVERIPDRRLSYVLLSGLPLRDYRADVDLVAVDDGTDIRWHASFSGKLPGTGWFYRRVLERFLRQLATGLAARAAAVSNR